MNKRIKELAIEAGLSEISSNYSDMADLYEGADFELEKFAELIILEVLSQADEMMRLAEAYLDKGIDIELDITKEIKNNFGIE